MSDPIKDGGAAFPRPDMEYRNGQIEIGSNGMTLRDWYAGQALAGLLGSGIASERGQSHEDVAEVAYLNADAMIAERGAA
jgi:hypothetical protein